MRVDGMTAEEMAGRVKKNLRLDTDDHDLRIRDVIQEVCDYCNLPLECLPDGLEPFVRGKVQGMITFGMEKGDGFQAEVASISEGDTSVSFVQSGENTREYVCRLNEADRSRLNRYRRMVW